MWRFITQLLKRFLHLNFSRFFLVISLLSALIPAYALDSIWYSDKDLKEGNPIQVAEFAVANGIANEPAFAWWIKDVLKKRERMLSAVKTRYLKRTHKFGIQMPKTVQEALEIDRETGTDFWRKATEKEMKNVDVAFEFLEVGATIPIGYQKIPLPNYGILQHRK